MPANSTLVLIDGSSQMYRAYHAPIRTNEGGLLRNAQGRPTNAVYIFVTMLRKLLADGIVPAASRKISRQRSLFDFATDPM